MKQFDFIAFALALVGAVTASCLFMKETSSLNEEAPSLGILEVAVFEDEKSGLGGFGSAGAWNTRDLNAVRVASGSSISLAPATSRNTLQPGIYFIEGSAPAYYVNGHQARFQNVTANTTAFYGTSEFTAHQVSEVQTRSYFRGYVQVVGAPQDYDGTALHSDDSRAAVARQSKRCARNTSNLRNCQHHSDSVSDS